MNSNFSHKKQSDVIEVISKPSYRRETKHTHTLMDAEGRQFDQIYTYLDFAYKDKTISVWWKSVSSPEPVHLERSQEYKFIIKLDKNDDDHIILEIWDKDKLVWRNEDTEG